MCWVDIKHYAVNDQESGRQEVVGDRGARETGEGSACVSDRYRLGQPGAVMCSYNGVNGDYACENKFLLRRVLKGEWKFPGFVISDWQATHTTVKARMRAWTRSSRATVLRCGAGEGGEGRVNFGGGAERSRASCVAVDVRERGGGRSQAKGVDDVMHGLSARWRKAAWCCCGTRAALPVERSGCSDCGDRQKCGQGHDLGRRIGAGGPAGADGGTKWRTHVWFPTSPLEAIARRLRRRRRASVGEDVAAAAAAGKARRWRWRRWQWESEGGDLESLSLPEGQEQPIAAVAKANPHTVVVLETGTAVTMPWLDSTSAVLEAWYGGSKGADAVARLLFGEVNPSGKLADDLPAQRGRAAATENGEASAAGAERRAELQGELRHRGRRLGTSGMSRGRSRCCFCSALGCCIRLSVFGAEGGGGWKSVTLTVTNTAGARARRSRAHAALPASAGEPSKRLMALEKVELAAGESKTVTMEVDPTYESIWDVAAKRWTRPSGEYKVMAGGSSAELPLEATFSVR